MADENEWPKVDGDIFYGSEATRLHDDTQDATDINKGIATFDETDFIVTTGDVAIDDSNTVRTVIAGEGIDVSSASGNPVISGENATTSNKGVASFNSNDFSVSLGAVSLKNKTSYASISPHAFVSRNPDTDQIQYDVFDIEVESNNLFLYANIQLPDKAIITSVIVYGSNSSRTWEMRRITHTASFFIIASGNINNSDVISSTVNNVSYSYMLRVADLVSGEKIYGARVSYTTDYD